MNSTRNAKWNAVLAALISVVPCLPRPVVLLESGSGRGLIRLAWGQRKRCRLNWRSEDIGRIGWIENLSPESRWYGFFSYDLGIPPRAARREPPIALPLADFFEPEHELLLDIESGEVVRGDATILAELDNHAGEVEAEGGSPETSLLQQSFGQPDFERAVLDIKEYIAAGDVYQVNLSIAQLFETSLTPWQTYLNIRKINPSPWMGFADFGDWQLVSGSPELLVETKVQESNKFIIRARPIAGTRKKTGDLARDAEMKSELTLDEKERAEHRMLVDLARNDLGRVAKYGSLNVSETEVVEEYSHVFHLVSQVEAVLREECTAADIVTAVFPGGTITGVPKIRAMEIIAELEPVARGAYTGGLGWLGPDGMQLNILIRSAVFRGARVAVQAGAGIVWDSLPEREWRESNRKAAAMIAALGAYV